MTQNPRQLAFLALRSVHRGAFADVALDKTLRQATLTNLLDRRLLTELVYGSVRRQRTLDALIDQLAKKPAQQQPADLRTILHLGLYQLCFLNQIPGSAAVNTTVDLAKQNGFAGLAGFVNGLLRQYLRLGEEAEGKGQEAGGEAEKAESRGQEAGGEAEKAEGRGQEAGGKAEKAKGRGQEAGGKAEKAEGRGQEAGGEAEKAEGRGQEAGGKAEKAGGKAEKAEGRGQEAGGKAEKAEGRGQEAGEAGEAGEAAVRLRRERSVERGQRIPSEKQATAVSGQAPFYPLSFILYPSSPTPDSRLPTPHSPIPRLGILHSYPDWIIAVWLEQLGLEATERLCQWMNQPPHIDLRVNTLRASVETVEAAMQSAGIGVSRVPHLPQALRLPGATGAIQQLPGFAEGGWVVQDSSAQLVSYLVDPQPGELVVDACAAPGGKTMHLAELMHDRGTVWACDRAASRLRKLTQNVDRLGLQSIQLCEGDSRNLPQFVGQCDRVLVDAPCSGLGTLHRHADARWRQTPETVEQLTQLQAELLEQAARWVKPAGTLVYATCTLHPAENEAIVQHFLENHADWVVDPPQPGTPPAAFVTSYGWLKVWSHESDMDGFFMARLKKR